MGEVATIEETKVFCNKVRAAGGAKAIKDLMPSYPTEADSCLVAKNLNFGCRVSGYSGLWGVRGVDVWSMELDTVGLAQKIGQAMKLRVEGKHVILPKKITRVAKGFDAVSELFEYPATPESAPHESPHESPMEYKTTLREWEKSKARRVARKIKGQWCYKIRLVEENLTEAEKRRVQKYWYYIAADVRRGWIKPSFVGKRGK